MKMSRLGMLKPVWSLARRGAAAVFALALSGGFAAAQAPFGTPQGADVELAGAASATPAVPGVPGAPALPGAAAIGRTGPTASSHPNTYTWQGDRPEVTDPGPNFYTFFYTGIVQGDARVSQGDAIERIPVPLNEWEKTKSLIIAKLTNFYQQANNQQPTALADFQRGGTLPPLAGEATPAAATPAPGAAPGAAPTPAATATPTPAPTPPPAQFAQDPGAFGAVDVNAATNGPAAVPGVPGGAPFASAATFDARAAAEWTFYYDQLVLWQYYCTRVLLSDDTDKIVEGGNLPTTQEASPTLAASNALNGNQGRGGRGGPGAATANGQANGAAAGQTAAGGGGRRGGGGGRGGGRGAGGNAASQASSTGDLGVVTASSRGVAQGQATANGVLDVNALNAPFGAAGAAPGTPGAPGAATVPGQPAVRETFDPDADFRNPEFAQRYRDRFMQAAETHETDVYRSFVNMLNDIDQHTLDRQQYDQWVSDNETKIHDFAENWRRLRDGETVVLDNTLFLITPEKLDSPPLDAINLNKNERLTPQDLLEPDGTVKKPAIQ